MQFVYTYLYTSRLACEVLLHVTQDGYSALMMATREGRTEVVSLLVKAGANTDLQNMVMCCG